MDEIERKFLVDNDAWKAQVSSSTHIRQGYIASTPKATVRVRLKGEKAYLTAKGATEGVTRREFEYEVPAQDARVMLDELALGPVIDKVRHVIPVGEHEWELDVFAGENEGLVMAEIELSSPDESFEKPPWVGREVSDDPRFYNARLAESPYSRWPENQ